MGRRAVMIKHSLLNYVLLNCGVIVEAKTSVFVTDRQRANGRSPRYYHTLTGGTRVVRNACNIQKLCLHERAERKTVLKYITVAQRNLLKTAALCV